LPLRPTLLQLNGTALRLLKHRDAICKTVCQNMQRGLDPARCGKDCSDYHLFKEQFHLLDVLAPLAEVMRDNEVQSEPVIAKFKEGAVLWRAMTVLQRCY
jgi:hypothetical protein